MKEWESILSELEKEFGAEIVREWAPRLVRFDAGNLYLEPRDSFGLNWFEEHVRPRLKRFVNQNQRPIKVHIGVEKKTARPKKEGGFSLSADPLDPEMSLDTFLPSEPNLIAHKLLTEGSPFNPIYLYGPPASGKTHLLMGAALKEQAKGKNVFFVRGETFTGHVVQAIRRSQMQEFRKVYREIDLLVIDDVHIFSRKGATQEEFFHTFNTLHTLGRPILLSANVPPTQLTEIEPRLVSRFDWGISLGLQTQDPSLILEKKASIWNLSLSEELKVFLVQKFSYNPVLALRTLAWRAKGAPLTPLLAERLLKDLIEKEKEAALTPEKIVKAVALEYGVTKADLLGKSQTRESTLPRQIAMYLCRTRLKMPFQKIGRLFGKDHSTVMSSVKQIEKALEEKSLSIRLLA